MKTCPQCRNIFNDDLNFCLDDGTTLIYESDAEKTIAFANEIPTQIIPPAQVTSQISTSNSSKWLFLIIGVLTTALAGMVLFIFIFRENKEDTNVLANVKNTETNAKPLEKKSEPAGKDISNSNETNSVKTEKAVNSVSNTIPNPVVNESLSPDGVWMGDWNSKSADYTANVTLEEKNGKVNGRIVWTLTHTKNQKKSYKIGATAVEYVQGTYDSQTRILNLRGIRKDDPNSIVILDRYNLSLSADNQTIIGKSINGKLILRR